MQRKNIDPLSITFAALADPTRRQILVRLTEGEQTVTELAEPFQMTQPAVSKHLKVLERAGLIVRGREAQWRPVKLHAEPLKAAADWVGQYHQHWEERFDRLDAYLKTMGKEEVFEKSERTDRKRFSWIRSATIDRFWPNRKGE